MFCRGILRFFCEPEKQKRARKKNTSKNNQPPIEFPVLESRLSLPFTNAGAMQLN